MSQDVTQKELLIRLMDKVETIDANQTRHMTFAENKLESIEQQAFKTNGRVTKNEKHISLIQKDYSNMKTVFATISALLTLIWAFVTFIFK